MAGAGGEGGEEGPCARYAHMFGWFFENADLSSTYKPVLLAAIIDAVRYDARREGGHVEIGMDSVAARFAKFYFDTADFSLRHTPELMPNQDDPTDDINMVTLVHREIAKRAAGGRRAGRRVPSLKDLASDGMARFRKKVVAEVIRPRALGRLCKDLPGLLRPGPGKRSLILDQEAADYMGHSRAVLKSALTAMVAKHLEQTNPA